MTRSFNTRQNLALSFGALMLVVIVLMTPWIDQVGGQRIVQLGAWAPLWAPPSASATIDFVRLGVEATLVVGVTWLAVWMFRD